jgi:hypothetical protein
MFCLKVEYYLDNNRQLDLSDSANATAMDQHAETVFDLLDKAERDKTPMRLKLIEIDETLKLARLTLAYQEEGPAGFNGGKKKKKEPVKRAKSPRPWNRMKRFEKVPTEEAPSLIE